MDDRADPLTRGDDLFERDVVRAVRVRHGPEYGVPAPPRTAD